MVNSQNKINKLTDDNLLKMVEKLRHDFSININPGSDLMCKLNLYSEEIKNRKLSK